MDFYTNNALRFSITNSEVVSNDSSADVDFRVESNGNANMLFVDAGSDHVNIGTSTDLGGVFNVSGATASKFFSTDRHLMSLVSTEAGASDGPRLILQRDSSSPADNDQLGILEFYGENDADEAVEYARINASILDASDGTEDGALGINTRVAGANVNRIYLPPTEAVFNENSADDNDFRVESSNQAHAFFVDGSTNTVNFGASANVNGADIEFTLGSGASDSPYVSLRNTGTSLTTDASARLDIGAWSNNGAHYNASGSFTGKLLFMAQGNDHAYASGSIESYLVTAGNVARANTISRLIFGCKDATSTSAVEYFRLNGNGQEVVFNETSTSNDFRVESNAETHMIFLDAGNNKIGMGLSNPNTYGSRLNVSGAGGSTNSMISCINTSSSGTRRQIDFFDGSSTTRKGSIETDGSNTSFNTSSDYRLKENITYSWDATTRLKQLKPTRFNFIADANKTIDGFLAHEVSSVVPPAVSGEKDAVDENNNIIPQSIDHSKLVPLLVKTIQELEARITALES